MSTLHPDLERLEQQYDQLVAAAEAGHISQADAISTLSGLSVTDANGAVWALNADGDYVRSAFPGAPAQIADPTGFATTPGTPQPTPATPGFPDPASTAAPGPFAAPFPDPGAGFTAPPTGPFPAPPTSLAQPPHTQPPTETWDAGYDPLSAPPAGFSPDTTFGPGPGHAPSAANPLPTLTADQTAPTAEKKSRLRSISDADRPDALTGALVKAKAFLAANKVLAAIVGLGIVLFVALSVTSEDAEPTKIPSSSQTPTTSETVVPDLPADEPGQPAPAVPAKAHAVDMISALASGRRDLVTGTVAGKVPAADLAKAAALWAGAREIGLKVTPGPAAASGQGALQNWTVTDGATTVATVKVTWVLAGNQWKLAQIPLF